LSIVAFAEWLKGLPANPLETLLNCHKDKKKIALDELFLIRHYLENECFFPN
jgi:hypothetical protein